MRLPDRQLPNYAGVKKIAELLGGKWVGGRTQAIVFKGKDAEQVVHSARVVGGVTNHKKVAQAFMTPDPLADKLAALLDVGPCHRILEPSAGEGALIRAVIRRTGGHPEFDVLDIQDDLRSMLSVIKNVNVVGRDFMEYGDHSDEMCYDRIIMNPPFRKNQDILHVSRAYAMLKPGGRLVAVMSNSWRTGLQKKQKAFREWLEGMGDQFSSVEEVEAGTFKESGTNIAACIVVLDRRSDYPLPLQGG